MTDIIQKDYDYISILGPTASGKTKVAIGLSEYFPLEVISVDSVSIYKGLDIGSAKPSVEERNGVKHHLIDICTLDEIYTVGRFVEDARRLIEEIKSRGAMPVFCGGTMMYMQALKRDYQMPKLSDEMQLEIKGLMEEKGLDYIYGLLEKEDPDMANRLHPNDQQRIQRALGVVRENGRSLSSYWEEEKKDDNSMDFLIRVNNRDAHRERIRERVDLMLDMGLQEECQRVLDTYGRLEHPALKSIGYKEMIEHIVEKTPTNDVREKICIATSQFVKRQMTWLNSWNNKNMFAIDLYEDGPILINVLQSVVESRWL